MVMTTIDSNVGGGRSGHTYTFTRNADGTTDVDAIVVREGKNFKGHFLGAVLGSVGESKLTKAFANTVKAIEARNTGGGLSVGEGCTRGSRSPHWRGRCELARRVRGLYGRRAERRAAAAVGIRHLGGTMSTITMHATTKATPQQYAAALTDFGPGRSKIFGNSDDDDLKVHREWSGHADVTEGSGGVWERLAYDWRDPNHIVARTTDSNIWGGRSSHTYTFTHNGDGTTQIGYVVVREGKNAKGKFLGVVLGSIGKGKLVKAFHHSVEAVEARDYPAKAS
jgi:hypothetical protein